VDNKVNGGSQSAARSTLKETAPGPSQVREAGRLPGVAKRIAMPESLWGAWGRKESKM
jgi:hypothetical protein